MEFCFFGSRMKELRATRVRHVSEPNKNWTLCVVYLTCSPRVLLCSFGETEKSSAIILHFFCCEALNCYCTSWASQTHQTEVTWLLLLFTGIVYSASTQGCFKVVQNKRRVCWMLWNFKMAQIWTPQTDNLSSRFLPTERAQTTQQPDKDVSPSLMLLLFLINFE